MIKVASVYKNKFYNVMENVFLIEDYIIGDIDPELFDPNYMVKFDYTTLFTDEVKEYVKHIHKGYVKKYGEDENGNDIDYKVRIPDEVYNKCLMVYKYIIIDKLNRKLDILTKSLLDKYSSTEVGSFDMQVQEAKDYLKNGEEADTHLIETIATRRGIDLDTLAKKIVAKNIEYKKSLGNIISNHQETVRNVGLALGYDELKQIALNNGIILDIFKD